MIIRTVLGDIEACKLKKVSMHEHLILHMFPYLKYKNLNLDRVDAAIQELEEFKEVGGGTIVEVTPFGCGRNINMLKSISQAAKVNIIAATGFLGNGLGTPLLPAFPEPPQWALKAGMEDIYLVFKREIEESAIDSSARVGIIKVATGLNKITKFEEKVFRAAAKTALDTGVSITTHCQMGTLALEQIKLLKDCGVPSKKIIVGHLDLNPDMKYYLEIQKTGVWLQFDRMGRDKYVPDKIRIDLISQLIKKGFTNQILLGSDMGSNAYWRSYGGSPGLRFLFGTFVKKLAGKGVSPDDITQITEENPPLALSISH